jgi:hypothetical protein
MINSPLGYCTPPVELSKHDWLLLYTTKFRAARAPLLKPFYLLRVSALKAIQK